MRVYSAPIRTSRVAPDDREAKSRAMQSRSDLRIFLLIDPHKALCIVAYPRLEIKSSPSRKQTHFCIGRLLHNQADK